MDGVNNVWHETAVRVPTELLREIMKETGGKLQGIPLDHFMETLLDYFIVLEMCKRFSIVFASQVVVIHSPKKKVPFTKST